jgi:hypothetical protein
VRHFGRSISSRQQFCEGEPKLTGQFRRNHHEQGTKEHQRGQEKASQISQGKKGSKKGKESSSGIYALSLNLHGKDIKIGQA